MSSSARLGSSTGRAANPTLHEFADRSHQEARKAGAGTLIHPVRYRADIDGLRAVAVVSVVLFHIAPSRFRAGGIGVDIFFVISGYLIGGIILASLDAGRFSFAEFYLRRVRRIFPAFAATVVATLLAAWTMFFPRELVQAAQSGLAALACAANIYFFESANYFMQGANKPLLHTWTLGVEEQFYFLFPPLALAAHRVGGARAIVPLLSVIGLASLGLSEWQVTHAPEAAFYLLPSRAWELALGVIVARTRLPDAGGRTIREIMALAGIVLIVASLLLIDPARRFPGLEAIPPCAGAALVLLAGQRGPSLIGQALSLPPVRAVGLASYSIYLWHWPVFVLLLHHEVRVKFTIPTALVALLLTFALGFLSWRFVEAPFRSRTMSARRLLAACGALGLMVLAVAGAILHSGGFPGRIPARALATDAMEGEQPHFPSPPARCYVANGDRVATSFDSSLCLRTVPDRPNWLLVGDSHAAMLWGALSRAYPGVNIMPAAAYGDELHVRATADGTTSGDFWNLIFSHYLPTAQIDGVLVVTRWGEIDRQGLSWLATSLKARGIELALIGPVPEYGVPVARLLAEAEWRDDPTLPRRRLDPRLWPTDDALRALSKELGLNYLSPMSAMCPGKGDCLLSDQAGIPLYYDHDHYTPAGSTALVDRLRTVDSAEGSPLKNTLGRSGPLKTGP